MASTSMTDIAAGKKPQNPVAAFSGFLDKLKPQLAMALPKHMNADRMARLALTAFSTTPALQQCTPQSIAGCIMTAAQLGLEPGIGGQGYLIPYKNTCTFVPGWKGLVDLVSRSGRATVWTGVVFEGDEFEYQLGDAPFCRHKPADGEGKFSHIYAIGRVKDAQMPVIEVWSRGKVEKHLKQFNKVGDRHYAKASESNFEMYARKVALLQVLKYMPASIELSNAMTVSHASEEGRGTVIEGDFVTVSDPIDRETGEVAAPAAPPAAADVTQTGPTYAQLVDRLKASKNRDESDLVIDAARHLPKDQFDELVKLAEDAT
ncbi:recombinase RecT [Variovorax sp. PAMC 28711]|uniref:recombinase RecT n=1 Tax=Variovorax sp. PAMC 28711 TaxID=1795631 RepID=UPI00078B6B75|nr:recombinase RecT [Variovorax sp. PAMC 28711]AMM23022.1 recombinase RecT [Variovorax sp. PAMC 28711]